MITLQIDGDQTVQLYQPLDAQQYLGVSNRTIDRWRREGWLLPAALVGRGYVYEKKALDECWQLRNQNQDRLDKEITE
jgi:predicted site-specific integrase-resolvase